MPLIQYKHISSSIDVKKEEEEEDNETRKNGDLLVLNL
jgi:hypothetical protein